jgi:hypothetical protein
MRFVVLYAGTTLSDARLVAVSSSREVVRDVARKILAELPEPKDATMAPLEAGRRETLGVIAGRAGRKR